MAREVDLGSVKGPKGDKGNSPFVFSVDEDTGDLYVYYEEGDTVPGFYLDESNGDLYVIIADE